MTTAGASPVIADFDQRLNRFLPTSLLHHERPVVLHF